MCGSTQPKMTLTILLDPLHLWYLVYIIGHLDIWLCIHRGELQSRVKNIFRLRCKPHSENVVVTCGNPRAHSLPTAVLFSYWIRSIHRPPGSTNLPWACPVMSRRNLCFTYGSAGHLMAKEAELFVKVCADVARLSISCLLSKQNSWTAAQPLSPLWQLTWNIVLSQINSAPRQGVWAVCVRLSLSSVLSGRRKTGVHSDARSAVSVTGKEPDWVPCSSAQLGCSRWRPDRPADHPTSSKVITEISNLDKKTLL